MTTFLPSFSDPFGRKKRFATEHSVPVAYSGLRNIFVVSLVKSVVNRLTSGNAKSMKSIDVLNII
jgi:hypothetical protein